MLVIKRGFADLHDENSGCDKPKQVFICGGGGDSFKNVFLFSTVSPFEVTKKLCIMP